MDSDLYELAPNSKQFQKYFLILLLILFYRLMAQKSRGVQILKYG